MCARVINYEVVNSKENDVIRHFSLSAHYFYPETKLFLIFLQLLKLYCKIELQSGNKFCRIRVISLSDDYLLDIVTNTFFIKTIKKYSWL